MTFRWLIAAVALVAAAALALTACGGSSSKKQADAAQPAPASASDFPSTKGKSLKQIVAGLGSGPMLGITSQVFLPGSNRFGFILVSPNRKLIANAPAAVYLERSGSTKASGPFPARLDPYHVKPQFTSQTVRDDPNVVSTIYLTDIKLPKAGVYGVVAVAKVGGTVVATQPAGIHADPGSPVPRVGQKAPLIDTPTAASVHGNLSLIDTRKPPDSMHAVNFADVYGKKPIVLLFATPALCQSRTCGPVTDVAEQVKSQYGKKAAFIHMEVYLDNTIKPGCLEGTRPVSQCYRPQFLAYHLPSEPWVFGIDRKGKVAARIEGPFGTSDLQQLVKTTLAH